MLNRNEFVSRISGTMYIEDESIIDLILENFDVDGEPLLDLFYSSEVYGDLKIDFGGGVYGITCRDVVTYSDGDEKTLRKQLGLRATKQNNELCADVIRLCRDEVARSGYLF